MISPLKDQVKTLKEHNIKACGIYEGMDKSDGHYLQAMVARSARRRLQGKDCIGCIWGLDFREDYRKVGILQGIVDYPVLTLTATCNTTMKVDIVKILGMSQVNTISFLPKRGQAKTMRMSYSG